MDARTGLVIGGMTAVAASVAVVCAVAMTNTAALKDSPATTVAASRILVPATSTPTASPAPTPTQTAPTVIPDEAEVVEAPAPTEVVTSAPSTSTTPRTPTTETVTDPNAGQAAGDLDSVVEAARAAGTWDSLRAWAADNGWSTGRIDALIQRLERAAAEERQKGEAQLQVPDTEAPAQKQSVTADRSTVQTQLAPSNQGASHEKPHREHPANAGSNGNGHGAGPETKKDQSRNSPDKRD